MTSESKEVLLVGNDVNNISEGYSWQDLLKDLIKYQARIDDLGRIAAWCV